MLHDRHESAAAAPQVPILRRFIFIVRTLYRSMKVCKHVAGANLLRSSSTAAVAFYCSQSLLFSVDFAY